MKHEFKVTKSKDQTVYTLESATSGGTSSGGIASVSTALGGVRKRGDNLLAQEADKNKVPATTPRNFVAKNAKTSGAGAHADKKKAAKQGDVKHKSRAMDMAEDHEIQMASSELQAIAKNALRLLDLVRKYSEAEGLEAWQQSKITKSADYLNSVLQSISGEQSKLEDHSNFGNGWGQGGYDTYAGTRHGRGVAEGERTMSRAAKGHEKYGKAGMAALAKAGRDGAGEEKLDKIRDKHDKYDSKVDEVAGPEKCWPGHRKVGTKPGTGKNAGKRVNDCEKIGEQGVAEGASDFVGDAIEALRSSKPGLGQEDFLDELYMYIENQYGQRAAEMMSNAGQDDFDEWYDSYTDMAEAAPKGWEGTVKAMKKHGEIDNPYALAHHMKSKGYKSHKEDAYMQELAAKIAEKLDPNSDVDVWIQDFQKADPNKYRQFKNKTPEKKAQMATSARYAAKNPSKK